MSLLFLNVWSILHLNIPLYIYSMIVIVYMNIMECVYVAITPGKVTIIVNGLCICI